MPCGKDLPIRNSDTRRSASRALKVRVLVSLIGT